MQRQAPSQFIANRGLMFSALHFVLNKLFLSPPYPDHFCESLALWASLDTKRSSFVKTFGEEIEMFFFLASSCTFKAVK